MQEYLITKQEYKKLVRKYAKLRKKQDFFIETQVSAMDQQDERESDVWSLAKELSKHNAIEQKETYLILQNSKIIETDKMNKSIVNIGSKVTLKNTIKETTYQICSSIEADPFKNKVSILSELGKLLLGKKINDIIVFNNKRFKIVKITNG